MSIMVANLYDALRSAGANDELARKAAEEAADYDNRLTMIEAKLSMLQWMVGINMAMTAGVLFTLIGFVSG